MREQVGQYAMLAKHAVLKQQPPAIGQAICKHTMQALVGACWGLLKGQCVIQRVRRQIAETTQVMVMVLKVNALPVLRQRAHFYLLAS